jgi:hypothetical protein
LKLGGVDTGNGQPLLAAILGHDAAIGDDIPLFGLAD